MSFPNDPILSKIADLVDKSREDWMRDYFKFLSFPSVSAEPKHKNDLLNCVNWLVSYLADLDLQVELWPTPGHPVIFASHLKAGPDQPTLLIYHHYDVQPVDPEEAWESPPFAPAIRDGEIYARGAQDNKGQCFYVLQALKCIQAVYGELPINIKLFIEGEEEIGSKGLSTILPEKAASLKADYLAIVDLGIQEADTPSITLGTRGIITMDVEVTSASTDLHSGFHGGILRNPIHVLTQLLSQLHDPHGRVTIPGFYDGVKEMTEMEKALCNFTFDPEKYFEMTGAIASGGETNYGPYERAWLRPTLEVNGIVGGYHGEGFKTVIPMNAQAKISCRLVPGQDPDTIGRLVSEYIEKQGPMGVRVKVNLHPGRGKAVRVSPQAPLVNLFSQAYTSVFGKPCEYIYSGGSIPIVPELAEASGADTLLMGLGLPSDQIHAPNEHFGERRLRLGILIMAKAIHSLKVFDCHPES